MKNILLILVGGTICTQLNENGDLSVCSEAGAILKTNFQKSNSQYANKVNIDLSENLYILSENMTVDKWNTIIKTYCKLVEKKAYDGVIFAHGTDTLAYSAALFSQLLSATKILVFFVSANKNLDAEDTNGNDNFRCAVECICKGINPNVYVAYKNPSDNQMYLHLASRLEQCKNYSDDFYSAGQIKITNAFDDFSKQLKEIAALYPSNARKSFVNVHNIRKLKSCVLMIEPYVGIDYSVYNYKKYSAVLHGTFHSGTACAQRNESDAHYNESSILYMIDKCAEESIAVDTYLSPAIFKDGTYETVGVIQNHIANNKKINFLYGYTKEMAYAKLLIAYSCFEDPKKREEFIKTESNFEKIK